MQQKFRLFVQKHQNGTYTVLVPGIDHVSLDDQWEDSFPATSRIAAHGLLLEEVKDDVREALEKWLAKADPSSLSHYGNYKEGQYLEKVEVEIRPSDRHGKKRHDRIRTTFSLMLTKEEDEQYRVLVPKLLHPPLAFFCYRLEELKDAATRELSAYFANMPLEGLLEYEYQRQEFLDEIEVSYTPLKPQKERRKKAEEEDPSFWALKSAGVNLAARAREGKLLRAFRRDREVQEVLNALASERSSSILLVGAPGVGKTAMVHEVARRIKEENCPPALRKRQLWSTSASQLIAGCSYIGQWQQKLQNLVDEVKKRRHVLHVDDPVGLMEAGRWSKGEDNMAQFLKPFLADGTVILIGETTPERHRVGENKDPGFLSQFRTLEVRETPEDETLSILGSVAAGLERQFNLRIDPSAREAAIELPRRFQPYRAFPGKAVAFLERVAADTGKRSSDDKITVTRQVAVSAFAQQTGLPEFLLSDHLTLDPEQVERHFEERLIGQPDAVQTVVDLVTVIKAGLNDPHKPLGGFFFVGPTGVGKTEMVKALAEYLFGSPERVLRFDMSEYAEPMNVSKLIGSALADQEGELTKKIRLQPFSVVLLDEFEKAHPSVFDVMLQVLGEGRLTDAAGRTADFRSSIVIMTSNLGASPREQRQPGLKTGDAAPARDAHFRQQVERFFRPEFVNRLDQVVVFRPLDSAAMRKIALREVSRLLEREGVTRRHLLVEIEDEVIDLLLETGFSPAYGARPLKREIERRVIVPLARYLVAHRVPSSQLIQVRREGDGVRLHSTQLTAARQRVQAQSGPLAGSGSPTSMDLKDLVEGFAALRLRLDRWTASDTIREIENEWKKLLAKTRRRGFVSHGETAHKLWERIYHLERLSKRLRQLKERADYLEEFATLSQRERYASYGPDLARSFTDLRRDTDFLEVELLCAHLKEAGRALLRLQSVGRAVASVSREAWTTTLAKMYLQWCRRKGYQVQFLAPVGPYLRWIEERGFSIKSYVDGYEPGPPQTPPWVEVKTGDFNSLLKRVEELDLPDLALCVAGTNIYGFLKSEAGTHKLLLRDDAEAAAPFRTVVARVEPLAENVAGQARLAEEWEEERKAKAEGRWKAPEVPDVIRLYQPDGDRYVRDVRTDVRTTLVREVLEGDLDDFILAYLKTSEAAVAWESEH